MSKHRVRLIMQREWLENVRTKGFWIGVLLFPVLLVAAISIPALLDKAKSARTYVVIDHSGWMIEAIERRADQQDWARLLSRWALAGLSEDTEVPGELREIVRILRDDTQSIPALAAALTSDDEMQFSGQLATLVRAHRGVLKTWWQNLSPGEARSLDGTIARAKFIRTDEFGNDPSELNRKLSDDELFAYFVIGADPVNKNEGHRYVSVNLTDTDLQEWFGQLVNEVVRDERILTENIDPTTAAWLREPLQFTKTRIGATGEETEVSTSDRIRQWAPTAFVYLLWVAVFSVSQMLLTNTIEEKSNRLMEVLLSSVSSVQLMLGKISGIAATGLTMLLSWMVFLVLAVKLMPLVLGTKLDLSVIVTDPVYITSFLVYFLLGYLFYASVLVAIGSVCNTLKEAQNLMTPIVLLLMLPLLAMVPVSQDPNGTLAKVLSFIPPFTPFVMMNRAAGPPSAIEYVATTLLLLASIVFVVWAAAKVFRIGVLMTGKPPKVREILRWIRAPIGLVPEKKPE